MIIAVIPAKSDSRRLFQKNMKPMLGKPLLYYTIQYAKSCELIDDIFVSTDSEEIADYARSQNVKVVLRPRSLCGEAIIVEVLKHCIEQHPQKEKISRVVALQVDHPDRTVNLTYFLKKTIEYDIADAITLHSDGLRSGSIRILRKKDLIEDKISYSILAYLDESTNIHTQEDFDHASERYKNTLLEISDSSFSKKR